MEKLFLFLYPHEIFFKIPFRWTEDKIKALDDSIGARYRNQGWRVGYVTYDNWSIHSSLTLTHSDLHIKDGQIAYYDKKNGVIRRVSNNEPAWPNPKNVIVQFPKLSKLCIGGFHDGSCTDIIAEEAYKSGIDTLVDEDLTNLFLAIKPEDNFNPLSFPGYDRCRTFRDDLIMKYFMERRQGKPWLYDWSKYPLKSN